MCKDYILINKLAYEKIWDKYKERLENQSNYEEKVERLAGPILEYSKEFFTKITVLEIGPGAGQILNYFESKNCNTIAVELSEKMARLASNNSPNSKIIVENILDVEFPSNYFEIIYAGALIHLFPLNDAKILINKINKWLKPEGLFFVNTTIHKNSIEGFFKKKDYKYNVIRYRRYWTERELVGELSSANFKIIKRLFTNEEDRKKKWVGFIVQKGRTKNA